MARGASDRHSAGVAQRMKEAVGDMTYRDLSRTTAYHPETIRRYLASGKVSTDFVVRLAIAVGVRVEWLLTGEGPRTESQLRMQMLAHATTREIVAALGDGMSGDRERIERLEARLATLEALLAASDQGVSPVQRVVSRAPHPQNRAM